MKTLLSYLLSPIFYLFFFIVLLVFQPVQWICWTFFGYHVHKKSVDFLNGGLVLTYYILGSRVRFNNSWDLPERRTILFVSNHQSMLDIPALIWFLRRFNPKFISKREVAKVWPSIGYNLKKSGAALIDRSDRGQALAEIERLSRFIKDKSYSVMLFPEGTRSRTGIMKPFAVKGFAKVLEINPTALIVPIAIENSYKIFKNGAFPLSVGEDLKWTVLEPIEPGDKPMIEIIRQCENSIRTKLGQEKSKASIAEDTLE